MKKIFAYALFLCLFSALFAQKYEAEEGDLHGIDINNELSGFSGSGYGTFVSTFQKASFPFEAENDGEFGFRITYSNLQKENERVSIKLMVDDNTYVVSQRLKSSSDFVTVNSNATVWVEKGSHKVTVLPLKGEWNLDCLEIVPVTEENRADFYPSNKLSNPNASEQAQAVFDYLVSMRGKGILSGQQIYGTNTQEIKTLVSVTGKNPAIMGIDLIDFSPSRVAHGVSGGRLVSTAKKYWQEGGLITCAWHWNAPSGLLDKDEVNKHWYDGFRKEATTFDFKNGIFNPDSKEYQEMLSDIDAIAKPLKQLRDAGVPVLWRPIHEASGGWFWWGAAGKEAYLELYKMLYDRLVNYHGLNNLIWVWNGQDPDWYPGDDLVDVVAYDSYPNPYQHNDGVAFLQKIQSGCYESKLCAISENGTLPNIVKLAQQHSVWSWFCTWNGDFVISNGKYSEKCTKESTMKLYAENPWYISRDEVPSFGQKK